MINQNISIERQWKVQRRMPKKIIPPNSLAMRAKVEREKLGLTQQEMAERISASPYGVQLTTSGYSKIEKNETETPHRDVLRAMKMIFGVSIDYLLDGEEPDANKPVDVFLTDEANMAGALIDKMTPAMRATAIKILSEIESVDRQIRQQSEELNQANYEIRLRREQVMQLLLEAMPDLKESTQKKFKLFLQSIRNGVSGEL